MTSLRTGTQRLLATVKISIRARGMQPHAQRESLCAACTQLTATQGVESTMNLKPGPRQPIPVVRRAAHYYTLRHLGSMACSMSGGAAGAVSCGGGSGCCLSFLARWASALRCSGAFVER